MIFVLYNLFLFIPFTVLGHEVDLNEGGTIREIRSLPLIPLDVQARLKQYSSHAEFINSVVIRPGMREAIVGASRQEGREVFLGRSSKGTSIKMMNHNEFEQWKVANKSKTHEYIDEPTQSEDSCRIYEQCVPLPIVKKQGFYYFPECIDVPQCAGGCCDNKNTCHATKKKKVMVKVRAHEFLGMAGSQPSFSEPETMWIEMERHEQCSCDECEPISCPSNQHWEHCRCVCTDRAAAASCTDVDREWFEQTCECGCKLRQCGANRYLDPASCRCNSISRINKSFSPVAAAPTKKRRGG